MSHVPHLDSLGCIALMGVDAMNLTLRVVFAHPIEGLVLLMSDPLM